MIFHLLKIIEKDHCIQRSVIIEYTGNSDKQNNVMLYGTMHKLCSWAVLWLYSQRTQYSPLLAPFTSLHIYFFSKIWYNRVDKAFSQQLASEVRRIWQKYSANQTTICSKFYLINYYRKVITKSFVLEQKARDNKTLNLENLFLYKL